MHGAGFFRRTRHVFWITTKTATALIALTLATLATPAWADSTNGYGVAVAARASNTYSGDAFASAFRTGKDSSGNFTRPGDTPSYHQDGCNYPVGQVTCNGGANGTQGTDYNLTAATASAGLTDDLGYSPPTFATGTADARANLATGELGVAASSDRFRSVRSGPTFVGGSAFAQMNDTLDFNISGAGAGTVTNIVVDFVLEGNLGELNGYHGIASIAESLHFGDAFARYSASINAGSPTAEAHFDTGWVSTSWDVSTPGAAHFTGVYALTGPSAGSGSPATLPRMRTRVLRQATSTPRSSGLCCRRA